MEDKPTIDELVKKVLSELGRVGYSSSYISSFKGFCKKIIAFALSKDEKYFSIELGANFLKEKCDCPANVLTKNMPSRQKNLIRKIRILEDYQLSCVIPRRATGSSYIKPQQFEKVLLAYETEYLKLGYSSRALPSRMQRISLFINFLDSRDIQDVKEISPQILSDYIKTIFINHEKVMSAIMTSLRSFLKFLYLSQYTANDLSLDLPRLKKYYTPAIPSAWATEDVKRMLQCIDRGSPTGKRDYVILLLVVRLGIRAGDIRDLKLHNLNWNTNQIEIQQGKTGQSVTYPILDDIGDALIDYFKNGRPLTDCPCVFVRGCAPIEAFARGGSLNHIINKYRRLAGITLTPGSKHGLHSLRHKLANTLLEQETPIPVISAILGHLSSKSTNIYLHTDLEGLKQCALDPDEVFKYET